VILNDKTAGQVIIEYPTEWSYKLVARDAEAIKTEVARLLGGERTYTLTHSNNSKSGKFVSYNLALTVESDADREGIYRELITSKTFLHVL